MSEWFVHFVTFSADILSYAIIINDLILCFVISNIKKNGGECLIFHIESRVGGG